MLHLEDIFSASDRVDFYRRREIENLCFRIVKHSRCGDCDVLGGVWGASFIMQ